MGKKTLLSLLRRRLKNRSKRVKIVFSGISDTILGKRIPFLCQTNLSLSLSLRSPLLSPIRYRALRARSRARIECIPVFPRRGKYGRRIFTSLGYSFRPLPPPRRQIDFHRDRDWKAAGPDNRKPGLRVYADFSFHGAAYADAVVFPVCPRGRRRVCLSTSAPRRPRYSTYPLRLCIYMLCTYVCVYVHLCV